jgi:hypothetical protein
MALIRYLGAPLLLFLFSHAEAQNPAPPRTQLPGTVVTVDAGLGQFSMKTDQGETVTVTAGPQAVIIHLTAGATDVSKGIKMKLAELQPGDRVVAFVRPGPPLQATSLVVRSRSDLSEMQAKEREDWQKRGSSGTVSRVDAVARTISAQAGRRSFVIHTGEKTQFRRYAADSAKPADAHSGTIADLSPGDQLHVLGNRAADGSIQAEIVYSGAFRQIAATIDSIDAAKGELRVTDLEGKKPLLIRVPAGTVLKRMPQELAQRLAVRYQGGSPDASKAGEASPALEQLPDVRLGDLKAREPVLISTTAGSQPGQVTAIMLLTGVEPLLRASPATAARDIMSGWNLAGGDDAGDQ